MALLSDQVDEKEIAIILRELNLTLGKNITGDVVEFGCYSGTTSVHLAKTLMSSPRELWLYDSFEGLPEKSDKDLSPAGIQFKPGELAVSKKTLLKNFHTLNLPRPRVKKAWFSELTNDDVPQKICFAFLDGDYYESILDPLKLIWDKLSAGACVIVDDYANEALPGAARAIDDWLKTHPANLKVEHSLAIFHKPD